MVYIAIGDFVGLYIYYIGDNEMFAFLRGTKIEKNFWWYTLFWDIGGILFFTFYFNRILKNVVFKKVLGYSGYTFVIFSIFYLILNWEKFFNQFFAVFDVLGAIVVFTCTVFYFIEILLSDRILTFYKFFNFYISAVIFIWWIIITPIVFYDNYLDYDVGSSNRDYDYIFLRRQIYILANLFMYLTYTLALIFCKREPELDEKDL